jgi:hypothetical protein
MVKGLHYILGRSPHLKMLWEDNLNKDEWDLISSR